MAAEGRSLVAWEDGRVGLTGKGHKKTFWGEENVLYLDCNSG